MMKRWLVGFAILAAAFLVGCRDDGLSQPFYAPAATPSPTPNINPTPTPIPGTTPFPTATPIPGGSSTSTGAAMTSASEQVTVVNFVTNSLDGSTVLSVQRVNGEIWTLTVAQAPALAVSDAVVFQSADLVFGSLDGSVLFADGSQEFIEASARIQ